MAWIESHQSLAKHRKTLATAGRLAVDRYKLIGHLHQLWWWGIENVGPTGLLPDISAFGIAAAAEWDGDPDAFVEALVFAGFIDRDPDGLYLHDWYEYAGKLLDHRLRERERSKDRRQSAKKPQDDRQKTEGRPPVGRRQQYRTGTVPNDDLSIQDDDHAHDAQSEPEEIWAAAVGVAARNERPAARAALQRCTPVAIEGNDLTIILPSDPVDRATIQQLAPKIRVALRMDYKRPFTAVWRDPEPARGQPAQPDGGDPRAP